MFYSRMVDSIAFLVCLSFGTKSNMTSVLSIYLLDAPSLKDTNENVFQFCSNASSTVTIDLSFTTAAVEKLLDMSKKYIKHSSSR